MGADKMIEDNIEWATLTYGYGSDGEYMPDHYNRRTYLEDMHKMLCRLSRERDHEMFKREFYGYPSPRPRAG